MRANFFQLRPDLKLRTTLFGTICAIFAPIFMSATSVDFGNVFTWSNHSVSVAMN